MNPTKNALSTAGKAGIVVILVVLVLGGVYFAPSMLKGSGTSTSSSQTSASSSSQTSASSSITGGTSQNIGMLSLFGYFSQMQVQETSYDHAEGGLPSDQHTVSYQVLGKASLNSTQYTKVQFSQAGQANSVVAWFNAQGGVDRADVAGLGNFTGNTAGVYTQLYIAAFTFITGASNNATLFSLLTKRNQTTTSVGPTSLDVVNYHLAAPTPPYTSIAVRYATIPGTNTRLVIFLDENTNDRMETVVQILSLTK